MCMIDWCTSRGNLSWGRRGKVASMWQGCLFEVCDGVRCNQVTLALVVVPASRGRRYEGYQNMDGMEICLRLQCVCTYAFVFVHVVQSLSPLTPSNSYPQVLHNFFFVRGLSTF